CGDPAVFAHVQVGPFVGHHADEHSGVRTGLTPWIERGVFYCPPRGLQEQTLLRIHRFGFTRGDAEEVVVESVCVSDESAGAVVDGAAVLQLGRVPSVGRDFVDGIGTVEQQLPKCGGVTGFRETTVEADDSDVHVAAPSTVASPRSTLAWMTSVSSSAKNADFIDERCTLPLVVRWIPARLTNTTLGAGTSNALATPLFTDAASSS